MKEKNKILKAGRTLFKVKNNQQLYKIAGAYFASLVEDIDEPEKIEIGSGIGTTAMNAIRSKTADYYDIPNLRQLTDQDGLKQLNYSNYIGPGTDLDHADKYGPVTNGPASILNKNGLSADHIAKIHDHEYSNAAKKPVDQRFDLIQQADKNMLREISTLPDSKTKKLIYSAINGKYKIENKLNRLLYGGAYFKRKKIGSGIKYIDSISNLENHIENIIRDKIALPKRSIEGKLLLEVETLENSVKKKLDLIKKEKDLETAAKSESYKPNNEADNGIINTYTKSGNKAFYDYLKPDAVRPRTMKYIIYFKKDPLVTERPSFAYIHTSKIIDPATNDSYIYAFPVNKDLIADNFKFKFIKNDNDKYESKDGDDLYSALQKVADNDQDNLNKIEIAELVKMDFIKHLSREMPYFNFQTSKYATIERYIDDQAFLGYKKDKIKMKVVLTKEEYDQYLETENIDAKLLIENELLKQKDKFDNLFKLWYTYFAETKKSIDHVSAYQAIDKSNFSNKAKSLVDHISVIEIPGSKKFHYLAEQELKKTSLIPSKPKKKKDHTAQSKRAYNFFQRLKHFSEYYKQESLDNLLDILKTELLKVGYTEPDFD